MPPGTKQDAKGNSRREIGPKDCRVDSGADSGKSWVERAEALGEDGEMVPRTIVWLLVVILAGCQEGRVGGVSTSLGSYERGLWFDDDPRQIQPHGWGVKFDIVAGKMIRPIRRSFRPEDDPWRGALPLVVLRSPMIGPFLSISLGPLGMYIGFKTFEVTQRERSPDSYGRWMRDHEFPDPNDRHIYLTPSFTLRRVRWR